MHDFENDFAPVLVDQQIEGPETSLSRGDARLVRDLQAMYSQEPQAIVERVWTRLAQHHTEPETFAEPGTLSTNPGRVQRKRTMQETYRTRTQRKRLPRLFTLVAALLVCAVLIGSTVLVFSRLRGQDAGTQSGGPGINATATTQPTTQPWNACDDTSNTAEASLCAAHKETTLNITKTYGTHKVTFLRAYADTTQLLLVYQDGLATEDATSFMSVTIQQGIVLNGGNSSGYANPTTRAGYIVASFPTGALVPSGATELHISAIADAFSGKATPLDFTVPYHTEQKTFTVNQTITANGVALTLQRVVFTDSVTRFYVGPEPRVNGGYMGIFVRALSINGQALTLTGGQSGCNADGTSLVCITLNANLNNKIGSWTVTIAGNQQKSTKVWKWTFHFTVGAD